MPKIAIALPMIFRVVSSSPSTNTARMELQITQVLPMSVALPAPSTGSVR